MPCVHATLFVVLAVLVILGVVELIIILGAAGS